ncbi:MAG: hypothetical protein ACT4OI_09980 [Methanobacteriota archaeon]
MEERFAGLALAVVAAVGVLLATSGTARAALERPTYAVGDRWVYDLDGSIESLPGFNATMGTFSLVLAGRVEVEVTGLRDTGGGPPDVDVLTETTAFLNGTFAVPGVPIPVEVTGSLTSAVSEVWDGESHIAIESVGTTVYVAEVTIFPLQVRAAIRLDATTAVTPDRAVFPLDVGESASAALRTSLTANTTFDAFGNSTSFENTTVFDSSWRRDVVALEAVTVQAGAFDAYRLNQTLVAFPGLFAVGPLEDANETAYFSNDTGSYVRRTAYVNGSEAAEMRLRSYAYAARAPGPLSLPILLLLVAVPVAVVGVAAWFVVRRRRRARAPPGGGPDAR